MDRYTRMLDETKLDILARMDAERIEMERVLQQKLSNLRAQLETEIQRLRPSPMSER